MAHAVERSVVIEAPMAQVFAVIGDYERYPEFLPEMRTAEVIERSSEAVVVRFELEIVMRVAYTLRLCEQTPDRVDWSLHAAKLMRQNDGFWQLESLDPQRTRATYSIEIALKGLIPKGVSSRLTEQTLPATLANFKRRAETLYAAAR